MFWSGGSQAVRLPKAMRLDSSEVDVTRNGERLVLVPVPEADDWAGFWDRLLPVRPPVRRWKTRAADKREPL